MVSCRRGRPTMSEHGAKSVAIKGLADKQNITLTFVVTMAGDVYHYKLFMVIKHKEVIHMAFSFYQDVASLRTHNTGRMRKKL